MEKTELTVGIFSPASPCPSERLQAGVDILHSLGFKTKVHPQTHADAGFLAGDESTRSKALEELLEDPKVDAIMAARGGYGCHRLFESGLPWHALRKNRKPLIGFSDLTLLHAALYHDQSGLPVHGPVVAQLPKLRPEDHAALSTALRQKAPKEIVADGPILSDGDAQGRIFGGCLSLVHGLLGTPLQELNEDIILLLEEIDEYTYRIDRMLTQLRISKMFQHVRGIVLGDFVGCNPRAPSHARIDEVLQERLGSLNIPVLAGVPVGHGARNISIGIGDRARVNTQTKTLKFISKP